MRVKVDSKSHPARHLLQQNVLARSQEALHHISDLRDADVASDVEEGEEAGSVHVQARVLDFRDKIQDVGKGYLVLFDQKRKESG